jgi:hypothetical protein
MRSGLHAAADSTTPVIDAQTTDRTRSSGSRSHCR